MGDIRSNAAIPPLFRELPPAARRDGPDTSKEADKRITREGKRDARAVRAFNLWRVRPGRTVGEMASEAGVDHYELTRACADGLAAGLLRKGVKRKSRTSGFSAHEIYPVENNDGENEAGT